MDDFEILHRKYAKALIELAIENKVSHKIEQGLERIMVILDQNQCLYDSLIHPDISLKEKYGLIENICRQERFCYELKDFLFLLLKAGRFKLIHGIFLRYRDFYDEAEGKLKVFVSSAFSLDNLQKNRLSRVLESRLKRRVILEERIAPELIGGIIIKAASQVFDNSLKKNLQILNQKMRLL